MAAPRLGSLDAFRGFVILTMIFVNYCSGMPGIPWWMEHAKQDYDGYTYVDVVFPGFLFIVGVAIPLSLQKRLDAGDSRWKLLFRVIPRALSLMFLGVIFVSKESYSDEATGMPGWLWDFIFYIAVMILWRVDDALPSPGKIRPLWSRRLLKVLAWAGMAYILIKFRQQGEDGQITWLRTSWWGILGMIGWAYLTASVAFLLTRGNRAGLMGVMAFLIALYIGEMHDGLWDWFRSLEDSLSIGGIISTHAALVLAGTVCGLTLFQRETEASPSSKMSFLFWFGLGLYGAGQMVRGLHKISKINGTDAYVLVTAGECALLLLLFYWLMDIKGWKGWAAVLIPTGVNPLLAYILPDFLNSVINLLQKIGVNLWPIFWPYREGWIGVANCAAMTIFMLFLVSVFTKKKVILKL